MTRSELVAEVARIHSHFLPRDVERIVDIIIEEINIALQRGDRVELRGFGAFVPRKRPARKGRNPRTGETVSVSEKVLPFFKAGKELRERVNHGLTPSQKTSS